VTFEELAQGKHFGIISRDWMMAVVITGFKGVQGFVQAEINLIPIYSNRSRKAENVLHNEVKKF
jgi:hypothetical protein